MGNERFHKRFSIFAKQLQQQEKQQHYGHQHNQDRWTHFRKFDSCISNKTNYGHIPVMKDNQWNVDLCHCDVTDYDVQQVVDKLILKGKGSMLVTPSLLVPNIYQQIATTGTKNEIMMEQPATEQLCNDHHDECTVNIVFMCLRLSQNIIGNVGASCLAKALFNMNQRNDQNYMKLDQYLQLESLVCSLSNTVRPVVVITFLDLSRNHICDDGATEIVYALLYNTTLRTLKLDYNEIGFDGTKAFVILLSGHVDYMNIDTINNWKQSQESTNIHPFPPKHSFKNNFKTAH